MRRRQGFASGPLSLGLAFPDPQNAWVVGDKGLVVRTVNRGAKWTTLTNIPGDASFGMSFVDRDNGWRVGLNGHVIRTSDGGGSRRHEVTAGRGRWGRGTTTS